MEERPVVCLVPQQSGHELVEAGIMAVDADADLRDDYTCSLHTHDDHAELLVETAAGPSKREHRLTTFLHSADLARVIKKSGADAVVVVWDGVGHWDGTAAVAAGAGATKRRKLEQ
jgi:hypothetical protein